MKLSRVLRWLPAAAADRIAFAAVLFVITLLVVVVVALLRADRRDVPAVLEAAASWLPWRARRIRK